MDSQFDPDINSAKPSGDVTRHFRYAIALLCWGLVLSGVRIEIWDLALYTTWLGSILVTLSLWILRSENKQLTVSFYCSLLLLLIRIASYWLGVFPNSTQLSTLTSYLTVTSIAILIIQSYCLFSGLRDIAQEFGNQKLGNRMMLCLALYLSLYVLVPVCILIPPLIIPVVLYALFVFIKIPYTINQLNKCTPTSSFVTATKPINKWVWLTLTLYIVVAIGGEFGSLHYVNTPNPEAIPYINLSSPETAAIRQRMLDLGLPEYVLNDLPDDEVLLFAGMYDASVGTMKSRHIVDRDGGSLEIIGFDAFMPGGKLRTLFYYRWLELPKHTYVDLISIQRTSSIFILPNNLNVRGLSLYDKNGKTYSQKLLNENETFLLSSYQWPLTQIAFRVYPHYENQRGYIAVDTLISQYTHELSFNSYASYVHQEHLWNRPHFAVTEVLNTSRQGAKANEMGPIIYWKETFRTLAKYKPAS